VELFPLTLHTGEPVMLVSEEQKRPWPHWEGKVQKPCSFS
jgi:hypothetical protein